MWWMPWMPWLPLLILIVLTFIGIAYLSTLLSPGCGCRERFTNTDFLAISHTISDKLPYNHFAREYDEDFFKEALDRVVQDEAISSDVNVYKNYVTSTYIDERLLKAANQLLLATLNSHLPTYPYYMSFLLATLNSHFPIPDFTYPYNMSRSKLVTVKTLQKGKSVKFIATTQHIVHRDSKAYGVSIELKTLHDSAMGSVVITGYTIHGYTSQDQFKLGCVEGRAPSSPWFPQQTSVNIS
jgi:hypothetical protein